MQHIQFRYPSRGAGRPQVLLIGNGLEHKSQQMNWQQLLTRITVSDSIPVEPETRDRIPFPLLYQLLSTHSPAPAQLSADDIKEEELRLQNAMKDLKHGSNEHLDTLPFLDADHIMTTNYSYCLEKAFFPNMDFHKSAVRSQKRFCLLDKAAGEEQTRELHYRLHTGYLAKSATRKTGLWHIHGECSVPKGIVLGHDRYGRLLQRIENICRNQRYSKNPTEIKEKVFTSWTELFLYADVYIVGLNLSESEFDLWWLLRRKQRESYSDGKVYFYERMPKEGFRESRHLLMQATGVALLNVGCTTDDSYDGFYQAALKDIRDKICESRKGTSSGK